ncbi:unnamed protein product, partial [Laminaria digitata]
MVQCSHPSCPLPAYLDGDTCPLHGSSGLAGLDVQPAGGPRDRAKKLRQMGLGLGLQASSTCSPQREEGGEAASGTVTPPSSSVSPDFHTGFSKQGFKCMRPGGCMEGKDFQAHDKRGPYHGEGIVRVSFKNPNRGKFDGFCPTHATEAAPSHAAAMATWRKSENRKRKEGGGKASKKRRRQP